MQTNNNHTQQNNSFETLATMQMLFDAETISHLNANNLDDIIKRNANLVKSSKDLIYDGFPMVMYEFREKGREFRVATPLKYSAKYRGKQFSFGAFDKGTQDIYLFFQAGQVKAKSRKEAFEMYDTVKKYCEKYKPNLIPFAIKLP
jgi:hypothetical protein